MDVSVVVTVHNKENEIARALESVREQTVQPAEVILVDDGSKDNSVGVIEKAQLSGLRLVRQENTGVYGSRNRGVVEARCDFVAFLDGDDTWEPRFLEVITEMRRNFPDCGIYGTAWQKRERSGEQAVPWFHGVPPSGKGGILKNYFRSVARGDLLCSSAVAVPKRIFEHLGMFSVDAGRGGDREMWLRIALEYRIAFGNEVLATWHLDASNRVSDIHEYDSIHPVIQTGELVLSRNDLARETRHGLLMHVTATRIFLARQLIQAGKREKALMVLWERGVPRTCVLRWLVCLAGSYLPTKAFCALYELYGLTRRCLGTLAGGPR